MQVMRSGGSTTSGAGGAGGGNSAGLSNLPPLPGAGSAGSSLTKSSGLSSSSSSFGQQGQQQQQQQSAAAAAAAAAGGGGQDAEKMLQDPATQRALQALKSMNADDLVARSEYLKAQRDRLLQLKKQQRSNVLEAESKMAGSLSRPKSARISKQLVESNEKTQQLTPEDEERIRVRKAINESIRREMMGDK